MKLIIQIPCLDEEEQLPATLADLPRAVISVGRVLIVSVLLLASLVAVARPAAASDHTITLDGRGFGHGRGMSQYGAEGYARLYDWSSAQILDHYYGGTTAGSTSEIDDPAVTPTYVRIRLQRMAGRPTRVAIVNGSLTLRASGGTVIELPADTKAVELRKSSATGNLEYRTGTTCTAEFSAWTPTTATLIDIGKTGATDTAADGSSDPDDLIAVCGVPSSYSYMNGATIWYPGSIRSQVLGGTTETFNITTVEKQLRSVVPNEAIPSWKPAALEAQAVAARSYALAGDTRWSGADTCDTIFCQVYLGWFSDVDGSVRATFRSSTDAAIEETVDIVRITTSGRVARTEFSSTSGGWTAGGVFPPVEDLGDVVSPVHTWTRTVSVVPLESAYGGGSNLVSLEVTKRNGLGAGGGRVVEAELRFSNGTTRTVSGNTVRSRLGLLSDWFFVPGGDDPGEPDDPCEAEAAYIGAVHELFLGRAATTAEIEAWCGSIAEGNRDALTTELSVSDEWAGVQIAELYRKILGRAPEASGREYWLGQVRQGLRIEDMATYFYGGAEYFARTGQTQQGFVERLYLDLLGRPADTDGRDYWAGLLDDGAITRTGAAEDFYQSIESRSSRVRSLYRAILGRSPDSAGGAYWAEELRSLGDVKLAAFLAASREFYDRATQ